MEGTCQRPLTSRYVLVSGMGRTKKAGGHCIRVSGAAGRTGKFNMLTPFLLSLLSLLSLPSLSPGTNNLVSCVFRHVCGVHYATKQMKVLMKVKSEL
jgi:hypothetical protein